MIICCFPLQCAFILQFVDSNLYLLFICYSNLCLFLLVIICVVRYLFKDFIIDFVLYISFFSLTEGNNLANIFIAKYLYIFSSLIFSPFLLFVISFFLFIIFCPYLSDFFFLFIIVLFLLSVIPFSSSFSLFLCFCFIFLHATLSYHSLLPFFSLSSSSSYLHFISSLTLPLFFYLYRHLSSLSCSPSLLSPDAPLSFHLHFSSSSPSPFLFLILLAHSFLRPYPT